MSLENIKHYFDLVIEGESTVPERYQIMLDQQKQTFYEIDELKTIWKLSIKKWLTTLTS